MGRVVAQIMRDKRVADAMRLGLPCYITFGHGRGGGSTIVAYVYLGEKYANEGVEPDADEEPFFIIDSTDRMLASRYTHGRFDVLREDEVR